MKAVCAWCQLDLGQRPGPADAVTHSICPDCAQAQLRKAGIEMRRDAERVARPVPCNLNAWLSSTTSEVGR